MPASVMVCLHLTHRNAHLQPAFFGLGHALRKQGKFEAAEEAYRRALGLVPRSASTLVALALTAQLRGDNTTAVELYHVALGLRPDDGYVPLDNCSAGALR